MVRRDSLGIARAQTTARRRRDVSRTFEEYTVTDTPAISRNPHAPEEPAEVETEIVAEADEADHAPAADSAAA